MSHRPSIASVAHVVDTLDSFPWCEWSQEMAACLGTVTAEHCGYFAAQVVRKAVFLTKKDRAIALSFDPPEDMISIIEMSFELHRHQALYVCEQIRRWLLRRDPLVPRTASVHVDMTVPLLSDEQIDKVVSDVLAGDGERVHSICAMLLVLYKRPSAIQRKKIVIRPTSLPCDAMARSTLYSVLKCFPTLQQHRINLLFLSMPSDTIAMYTLELMIYAS